MASAGIRLLLAIAASASALQRGVLHEQEREGLKYELFLPVHKPHASSLLPVLVFLHGRGESGGFDVTNAQSLPLQLLSNVTFAAAFGFIVVVPQCPFQCAQENGWLPTTLQKVTQLVRSVVLGELGGDPTRVYLSLIHI